MLQQKYLIKVKYARVKRWEGPHFRRRVSTQSHARLCHACVVVLFARRALCREKKNARKAHQNDRSQEMPQQMPGRQLCSVDGTWLGGSLIS